MIVPTASGLERYPQVKGCIQIAPLALGESSSPGSIKWPEWPEKREKYKERLTKTWKEHKETTVSQKRKRISRRTSQNVIKRFH